MYQIRRIHSQGSSPINTVKTQEEAIQDLQSRRVRCPGSNYKIFLLKEVELIEEIVYTLKEVI